VNPAGFQTNRFRWQITDSGATLANVWSPNQGAGLSASTTWDSTRTPLFRTCLVRSWFDEIQNGAFDTAPEANATLTAYVTVVKMRLKSVTFSGEKIHTVQKDDGTGAFPSPHWLDTNMNGTIETGENKSPVSYTCTIGHWYGDDESYMSTGVEIVTAGLPPSLPNIYIRATDANGKNYEFVGGGTVTSGSPDILAYTAGAAQCSTEILKDTVDYMNPLTLNWEVTWGGSPVWHPVGQSQNTAYITWRDPTPATLYETVLLVGCRGANGTTSSDEDDIIAGVWSEFTSVSDGVERADGVHMGYWLTQNAEQNLSGMLQNSIGDGACTAWAQLLHWSLEAQGLGTHSSIFQIDPIWGPAGYVYGYDDYFFMVKEWTFSGNGVNLASDPDWPYQVGTDATPATRIGAQNNSTSSDNFYNHWVCIVKDRVYDPSYGVGNKTKAEHENGATDGYVNDINGHARKNNTSALEFRFERDATRE
jgi:hypothetical protein